MKILDRSQITVGCLFAAELADFRKTFTKTYEFFNAV
jgi:hypothetical protein